MNLSNRPTAESLIPGTETGPRSRLRRCALPLFFLGMVFQVMVACGFDQQGLLDEGVSTLCRYLAVNTTNPPGNEMETARFLKTILDREGIENQIFDLGNNRANIYAILRGNQSKKGVILLHHMDVVPAESKFWRIPPFSGKISDGEIYGRGAVDIKGKGIIDLMAMIVLKRRKTKLARDIIFLGVADEEANSLGAQWMIKQKRELVQGAEFLLDEGESIRREADGNAREYPVSISEKMPLWLTLVFHGPAGHGSIPAEDSSANRLIRAATRILQWKQPFQVTRESLETIRHFLEDSAIKNIPRDLETALKNPSFLETIAKDPEVNAALRNTIAITQLSGSDKINTMANEARLGIDCRLLPGTSPQQFLADLKNIIGDPDMNVVIDEQLDIATSTYSPLESDFLTALGKCAGKWDPGAKIKPMILLSSTDSAYFRAIGIKTYGFESYRLTFEESERAHGNDERLSVENVKFGIQFLSDLLTELCGDSRRRGRKKRH